MVNCLISFNTPPIRLAARFLTALSFRLDPPPLSLSLSLVFPSPFSLVLFSLHAPTSFFRSVFHFLVPSCLNPPRPSIFILLFLPRAPRPFSPSSSSSYSSSSRGRFYLATRRTHGRTIDEEGTFPSWPFHPRRKEVDDRSRCRRVAHERKKSRA